VPGSTVPNPSSEPMPMPPSTDDTGPETEPALSACGRLVRRHDHDRYLTCLFAKPPAREAMFAIFAFNVEVAKTREVVTQPMLGQIRLQWWRESIEGIYEGRPRHHEVILPLAEAVARHDLTRGHFDRIIDARETDLLDETPATLAELEDYCEATASPLLYLSLEALGVRNGAAHDAARHLGIAWALAGIARAVPFHARQKRILLPREVTDSAGADRRDILELRPHEGLSTAVLALSQAAWGHLNAARALRAAVPATARPALLSAALVESHLKILAKARQNPFDARVQAGHPLRQARLILNATLGRY